jgi:alpha-galactosidase
MLALSSAPIIADARSKAFPPGWNGLARTPPMGWRSWNAFGNRITQEMMLEAANAIVAKNRTVAGHDGKVSLCDLGYCSVGVDEGWEGCGSGVNGTQHAADGTPEIDAAFPDTAKMVSQIHDKGLAAGWYLNGCKCGERTEHLINYEGDVRSLHGFGFDGVKIDGSIESRTRTIPVHACQPADNR